MASVQQIFKIRESPQKFFSAERQSIEQTEDYAIKKVIETQELVVEKLYLDKASETYFTYNQVSSELELYVNGVLIASW